MLNKILLAGNLTKDLEVKELESGFIVGKTAIAVNEQYKTKEGEVINKVMFIDLDIYGERAKKLAQYLTKGKPVIIEGKILLDTWVDPEGTKRQKHKVAVEKISFIPVSKKEDNEKNEKEQKEVEEIVKNKEKKTKKESKKKEVKKEVPKIEISEEDVPF